MKRPGRKPKKQSIWTRDLLPPDPSSVWRRDLIPEDSILAKDIFAFAKRKSPCLACPVLMVSDARRCNRYERIPDDIWDGIENCPLYDERAR
ncbi:MAG TPA: hypothetical protein VIK02_08935 [Candidatus Anoxymicrobiaceae bacterium]